MAGIHSKHLYFLVIFELSQDGTMFKINIERKSKWKRHINNVRVAECLGFLTWIFIIGIPRLERCKNSNV